MGSETEKCIYCGADSNSLYSIGGEAEKESSFHYNPFDRENIWRICQKCGRKQPELRNIVIRGKSKVAWRETDSVFTVPFEDGVYELRTAEYPLSRFPELKLEAGSISLDGERFDADRLPVTVKRYFAVQSSQTPVWEEITITVEAEK